MFGASPQARKQHLNLDLSLDEKEIFCSLNFANYSNPELITYQNELAATLGEVFQSGSANASQDLHKAARYKKKAGLIEKIPENSFTTANAYRKLGWFTSLRLIFFRFNRFVDQCSQGSSFIPENINLGIVKIPSSIGGLSYGIELLIDLGAITKSLFKPGPGESKNVLTRFKNIFTKDNRPYRMLNAALWLGINIATLIITGGMSAILNISGFSGDVIHEVVRAFIEIRRYNKLLNKVDSRLKEIDSLSNSINARIKKIETTEVRAKELGTTFLKDDKLQEYQSLIEQRDALKSERASLIVVQKELKEKISDVKKNRAFIVSLTTVILVGMVMILFSSIPLLGPALVFGASLLFLGKRIKDTFFSRPAKPMTAPIKENVQDSQVEEKPIPGPDSALTITARMRESTVASRSKPTVPLNIGRSLVPMASLPSSAGLMSPKRKPPLSSSAPVKNSSIYALNN